MAESTGTGGAPAESTDGGARGVKHTVTARTKARRRAVEILFEADQRGLLRRRRGDAVAHAEDRAPLVVSGRESAQRDGEAQRGGSSGREDEAGGDRSPEEGPEDLDRPGTQAPDGADAPAAARSSAAQRLREFAAERAVHSANHTEAPAYTREILAGVADHLAEIDEIVETYAQGWVLHRMPAVDRAIARLATWEIVYNDDVDAPVALDEAMTLARMLSTDESPRYLGGLLGRIGDLADTLR